MKIIQPVLLISGSLCHSPQLHLRVDQWEWSMTDVSTNHNYSWLIVPCQLVKELDQVLLHIHYHEIKRTSLIGQTVAQVMAGRAPLWKNWEILKAVLTFFFFLSSYGEKWASFCGWHSFVHSCSSAYEVVYSGNYQF